MRPDLRQGLATAIHSREPRETDTGHGVLVCACSETTCTVPPIELRTYAKLQLAAGIPVMSSAEQKEHAFCELMDALEASLQLRAELDQSLKAGHLSITKARYAMGPSSIGQANYGSVMQAGTYLEQFQNGDTDEPFTLTRRLGWAVPSASNLQEQRDNNFQDLDVQPSFHPISANAQQSSTSHHQAAQQETRGMQNSQPVAEQNAAQSQAGTVPSEYSSSVIADLAAKFGSGHIDDSRAAQQPIPNTDPLKWFGYMVSPYLRQAQSSFAQATEAAIKLANTQHQIITAMSELNQVSRDHHKDLTATVSQE